MNNKIKKSHFFYDNRFMFIAFGVTALVMLIIYICNQMFPFGNNTILRMDLYHQYGPLFSELYDKLTSGNAATYSWQSGLGSCFLGNYFNYLSSPIGAIVVFFGHSHVPEAIAVMVLIKAALSASTFTYYLKKSQHNQSMVTVAFGVLYAFCAYMLAYYWNVMWLDAMILLPIILLGIERIINNGQIRVYVIALALSLWSNYYMSYMLCLFAVIYFFYYYIISNQRGNAKHFFSSGVKFAVGSLFAAGIIACALIPTYNILQSCSATSGNFPDEIKEYFTMFDFFANHFGSLETTIRSSGDDVLPNVYCGVLTIILAPLYFFSKSISKKEKLATIGLLATLYASFNLNFLNYLWHGMHFPNDLPYRFSFIYSFILLVMAYKTFMRLDEFKPRQIGVMGAALLAFVIFVEKITSKNVNDGTVILTIILLIFYVLLLTVFADKRYHKPALAVLLLVCVCSEVIMCDTTSFSISVDKDSYASDYSQFREVKDKLDVIEDGNFYRMELSNLRTRMDPCWYGYNGVSVFSSMAYEAVAELQDKLGMMSNTINSYTYFPQTPVYNMMFSMKYIVNNTTPNVLNSDYYKSDIASSSDGTFEAYKNKYYLPIAFCVDNAMEEWTANDRINPFQVQGEMFDSATGVGDPFEKVDISYINYSNTAPFADDINGNQFYFEKTTADSDGSSTFFLTTKSAGNVYIYVDVDGSSEKDITISSSSGTITRSADHDSIVDAGTYGIGESISVNVPFETNSGTVKFYAYTINNNILKKGYKKLSDNQMIVNSFTDDNITGTVTAKKDCILYTSIPYDEGWNITVDGEKVSQDNIIKISDALLAIKLEKGTHDIEMQYIVKGFSSGISISFITALIFLVYLLISLIKKHSKKPQKARKSAAYYTPVDNSFNEYITLPIEENALKAQETLALEKEAESHVNIAEYEVGNPQKIVINPPAMNSQVQKEIISPVEKVGDIEVEEINPEKE